MHASDNCVTSLLPNVKHVSRFTLLLMCRFLMLSSVLEVPVFFSAENLIQIFDCPLKCYTSTGNLIFDRASGFL